LRGRLVQNTLRGRYTHADAEKARVFDRFYSADPSRTDKHNFGLGLSVAKELARLHHADLTVTDTPGGGAKFAVTFAARIS